MASPREIRITIIVGFTWITNIPLDVPSWDQGFSIVIWEYLGSVGREDKEWMGTDVGWTMSASGSKVKSAKTQILWERQRRRKIMAEQLYRPKDHLLMWNNLKQVGQNLYSINFKQHLGRNNVVLSWRDGCDITSTKSIELRQVLDRWSGYSSENTMYTVLKTAFASLRKHVGHNNQWVRKE